MVQLENDRSHKELPLSQQVRLLDSISCMRVAKMYGENKSICDIVKNKQELVFIFKIVFTSIGSVSHGLCAEVRGQLHNIGSLLLPFGSWELNLDPQACMAITFTC